MKRTTHMDIDELLRGGWGSHMGTVGTDECRARYYEIKASQSNGLLKVYNNTMAGWYNFWNELSF